MHGIFISYRRQDSQSAAGRLADDLKEDLPQATVFRDVETIAPGVDFAAAIERALHDCDVLLAVIGPRWLGATDAAGQRRLDNPGDYTRIEIATALKRRDVRVIPILVEGATMPEARDLPEDLQALARRNALELTDGRWRYDVSRLAETVAEALGLPAKTAPARSRSTMAIGLAIAAAILIAATLGYRAMHKTTPDTSLTSVPIASPQTTSAAVSPPAIPAPPGVEPKAASSAAVGPCPLRLSINRELPTPFTCHCDAARVQQGSVWGSDVYTDDSGLCRAAVHAGVIAAAGGTLTVIRDAGRALYVGSRRNGIETSDYGAYSDSMHFVGAAMPVAGPPPCPLRLSINRALPSPFTCRCDAQATQQGSVWGSDMYTDDSGLCRAAVHAGAIPPSGGTLTVLREPGRALYTGSVRNGVQSSDYGAYSDSMHFLTR